MKKISILVILVTLTMSSCQGQKRNIIKKTSPSFTKTINNKTVANIIKLREKETIFDKEHDLNLTFKKVIKDDRCPINAKCISAGEAIVEIELMSVHSRPQTFRLSTDKYGENTQNMILFSGYEIYLEALTPHPEIGKLNSKKSKFIKLRVKKHTLENQSKDNSSKEDKIMTLMNLERLNKKEKPKKAKAKLLENYNSSTSEFRIHPAEVKND